MPRPPSADSILKNFKAQKIPSAPVLPPSIVIPNLSGDHSAGVVRETPSQALDIANKQYVDDQVASATGATPISCRVRNSSTQAVGTGGTITLSWDTEDFDTDTIHDAADPTKLTIKTAGKYLLGCNTFYSANALVAIHVLVNGTQIAGFRGANATTEASAITTIASLAVNDVVTFQQFASAAGNVSVNYSHAWCIKLSD